MSLFAFHPELFEHRTLAFERLAAHQFNWFEHFSSIDLLHDIFGLEVCGIAREADATQMFAITRMSVIVVGRWSFTSAKSEDVATNTSNQSLEPTATRRVISFSMTKTFNARASRAPGSGGSAPSR